MCVTKCSFCHVLVDVQIRAEEEPVKGGRELGIIIGASIGGACIIICTLIFLLRNRCIL